MPNHHHRRSYSGGFINTYEVASKQIKKEEAIGFDKKGHYGKAMHEVSARIARDHHTTSLLLGWSLNGDGT